MQRLSSSLDSLRDPSWPPTGLRSKTANADAMTIEHSDLSKRAWPRPAHGRAAAREARRHPVRWGLERIGIGAAVGAMRAMPESLALATGSGIGRAFSRVDSHYRRLALANVGLVFPDWTAVQRRDFVRRNFAEMGRAAAEWARMPSLSDDEVRARVDIAGIEHLQAALEAGRGALVATAHYGYWEMILRAVPLRMPGFAITAVEAPQPNPYLAGLLGSRRYHGGQLLRQDALSIRRALRHNAAVGVLADHYLSPRKGGVLAPFLGMPAWSNPGPAVLALSARCPVVVAHIRRVGETHHRLEFATIEQPDVGERVSAIAELTTRINAAIGEIIRSEPESWLWSNHRWRGSPAVPEAYPSRRQRRRSARSGPAGG